VEGVVQGVGFRPFVHRLAREHTLSGWVRNDERGVLLEVEGEADAVERFMERLRGEAPPLAAVERVDAQQLRPSGDDRFEILPSAAGHEPAALIPADVAPCAACLRELLDPGDRRHRYPFINCTDCGPRFTIVCGVPYDRALTTMAGFEMCADCRAEYEDPSSRRFHAQPNACATCGPTLRLIECSGRTGSEQEMPDASGALAGADTPTGEDALAGAVAALVAGRIVAVKGLGGYHLACRADDERAVAELRRRKHREEKPFALMSGDLSALEALVELSPAERELCSGHARPIVIARRRAGAPVAAAVAPGLADLGVMLPSTPLHHLLLTDTGTTLVMTSGNLADEPIAHRDDDALARLSAIADAVLAHDRPIQVHADDSVVRSLRSTGMAFAAAGVASAATGATSAAADSATSRSPVPLMIRRARGYVPGHLPLALGATPLLACGAELKSTFCLATGPRAWVGQHIGDLRDWQALRSFEKGIAHFEALFAVRPEVVAHDLHPDYLSTAYAQARDDVKLVAVQHHHAHMAAVLAEHGECGPAIGAIYDGAGLGADGTIWGGELLLGDLESARRVGHLHEVRLPGGDAAVREPWRMACAWLQAAGVNREDGAAPRQHVAGRIDWELVDPGRWEQVSELVRTGTASPITTSVGRLCDAVAALCGIRMSVREEGRAAMELEAAAAPAVDGTARGAQDAYPLPVVNAGVLKLDARATVLAIVDDLAAGTSAALVGARFHNGLADATVRALETVATREGVNTTVLSGGVFQNRLLLGRCITRLAETGLRVLIPRRLPPNDGAISYGQAAVAAATLHT